MRDLILATQNPGKMQEMREALQGLPYRILSPKDLAQALPEVEETGETLLENAQLKARAITKVTGLLALADDTGLEVDALDGAPGVYSARWAGPACSYEDNNRKLLAELEQRRDQPRGAVFRTVMVLAEPGGREDWVAGRCEGVIAQQAQGAAGFGYDPVFYVPSARKTFAQMTLEEKNRYSHRGEALRRARLLLERW
jgi:XTP/dITP diphosphohydrolase